ncbi:MAG: tRNA 5-methoxyuridine(34)/uridine 5-oxyacetic acid(34) synthase CmoB [Candidatus Rifleibacteriota bacterium]
MTVFDFSQFYQDLSRLNLEKWKDSFFTAIERELARPDGNLPRWQEKFAELPELVAEDYSLNESVVRIGTDQQLTKEKTSELKKLLLEFMPWRKGPYNLFGVHIDTEWRSDMKWDRISSKISDLRGRIVADIGCGNGYHMFRMLAAGAQGVVGADPSILFLMQFMIFKKYLPNLPVYLLPIGIEDFPETQSFDTVFSMGVFYHRKSPFDFLRSLKMLMKKGGELVLETLIIPGGKNTVLVPENRYACMKNVWFIPSVETMTDWMKKAGFLNVRLIDSCKTTFEEQRATEWITGKSLDSFLDSKDDARTVEGYPAPVRAVFVAER